VLTRGDIDEVRVEAVARIAAALDLIQLEEVRLHFFGKKGKFSQLMRSLGNLSTELKKEFGQLLNLYKQSLDELLETRRLELDSIDMSQRLRSEKIDVTLPVDAPLLSRGGGLHPLTRVRRDLEHIFRGMGFSIVDGPEVEREYYNFEALNVPATHPARDMQDTFWTKAGDLLRTHTSSIQARALEHMRPPLRIVAPGRCFRYERLDASHEHTFYQMEGMMIDREISVAHLIYFMKTLLREIFGQEQKIRLRPGYFPFVEPGFELDIWFRGRWLELLPCGLVHPKVLEFGGIDPKEWQGFAFGLGLSRLVMTRYQIDDIRHLQSGDLRFLEQFR